MAAARSRNCVRIGGLLMALTTVSCDANCKATSTRAEDSAAIDAGDVTSSGVLRARLQSGGEPLAGKSIEFYVQTTDGAYRHAGAADTGSDGVASFDLKQSPADLLRGSLGGSYRAVFDGDGRYCSSRDRADLDIVQTP